MIQNTIVKLSVFMYLIFSVYGMDHNNNVLQNITNRNPKYTQRETVKHARPTEMKTVVVDYTPFVPITKRTPYLRVNIPTITYANIKMFFKIIDISILFNYENIQQLTLSDSSTYYIVFKDNDTAAKAYVEAYKSIKDKSMVHYVTIDEMTRYIRVINTPQITLANILDCINPSYKIQQLTRGSSTYYIVFEDKNTAAAAYKSILDKSILDKSIEDKDKSIDLSMVHHVTFADMKEITGLVNVPQQTEIFTEYANNN